MLHAASSTCSPSACRFTCTCLTAYTTLCCCLSTLPCLALHLWSLQLHPSASLRPASLRLPHPSTLPRCSTPCSPCLAAPSAPLLPTSPRRAAPAAPCLAAPFAPLLPALPRRAAPAVSASLRWAYVRRGHGSTHLQHSASRRSGRRYMPKVHTVVSCALARAQNTALPPVSARTR